MAVSAVFQANFASFVAEVQKTDTKLRDLQTTSGSVARDLGRIGDSFSGRKILSEATLAVKAVTDIGGASKLTESEQGRLNSTLNEAIAKYHAMGQTAPQAMTDLEQATRKAQEPTEGLGARITGLVAAGAAAAVAMREVIAIGVDWVTASNEQENAAVRLDTALRAQGSFTPQLSEQYGQLASAFENTTVFSDELITEMEALLVTVGGVMPKDMKAALTASTDLAAGLRIDLGSATELVAKALEGNLGALKRHGIVIDETAFKVKGATAVFEAIADKMGGQASAQAQTFSGQMARVGNTVNNVQESLGGFIASALSPLIDVFTSLPSPISTSVIGLGLLVGVAGAGAAAVAGLTAAVTLAAPFLGVAIPAGATAATIAMTGLSASVGLVGVALSTVFLNPIGLAVIAIAAAAAGIYYFKGSLDTTVPSIDELGVKTEMMQRAIEAVAPSADTAGAALHDYGDEEYRVGDAADAATEAAKRLKIEIDENKVAHIALEAGVHKLFEGWKSMGLVVPDLAHKTGELKTVEDDLAATHKKLAAATKEADAEATKLRATMNWVAEENMKAEADLMKLATATEAASAKVRILVVDFRAVPPVLISAADSLDAYNLIAESGTDALVAHAAAAHKDEAAMQALAMSMPNLAIQSQNVSNEVLKIPGAFAKMVTAGKQTLGDLNNVFQSAFEGGGNIGGAFKSLATNALANFATLIPGVGPIIAQFSGAIIAGLSKLGSLFGIGKSEGRQEVDRNIADIKKLQDELLKTQGSLDNIRIKGGAAGEALAAAWKDTNLVHFKGLLDEFNLSLEHTKAVTNLYNDIIGTDSLQGIANLQEAWARLTPEQLANEHILGNLITKYEGLRDSTGVIIPGLEDMAQAFDKNTEAAKGAEGSFGELTDAIDIFQAKIGNVDTIDKMRGAFEDLQKTGKYSLGDITSMYQTLRKSLGNTPEIVKLGELLMAAAATGTFAFDEFFTLFQTIRGEAGKGIQIPVSFTGNNAAIEMVGGKVDESQRAYLEAHLPQVGIRRGESGQLEYYSKTGGAGSTAQAAFLNENPGDVQRAERAVGTSGQIESSLAGSGYSVSTGGGGYRQDDQEGGEPIKRALGGLVSATRYFSIGNLVRGTAGGIVPRYLATGNLVKFVPKGTDKVAAMLTEGERVLSVSQNKAFEALLGIVGQADNAGIEDRLTKMTSDIALMGGLVAPRYLATGNLVQFPPRGTTASAMRTPGAGGVAAFATLNQGLAQPAANMARLEERLDALATRLEDAERVAARDRRELPFILVNALKSAKALAS